MGLVTSNEDPSVRATHPSAKKRVRLRSLLSCFSPVDSNMAKSKRFVIGKPIGVGSFGKVGTCPEAALVAAAAGSDAIAHGAAIDAPSA